MSYCVRIRSRWASSSLPWFPRGSCRPPARPRWRAHRPLHRLRARDVVRRREDPDLLDLLDLLPRQRVEVVEGLDLVAEELDPQRELLVGRDDLDGSPRTRKVPRVKDMSLRVYCTSDQQPPAPRPPAPTPASAHRPVEVGLRGTEAVEMHDTDATTTTSRRTAGSFIVAECRSRSTSSLIELLLDVGVGLRDVGLGLVVVVVRIREVLRAVVVGQHLSRSSFASCAARVLFGAITSVGRCCCSISQAVVADLLGTGGAPARLPPHTTRSRRRATLAGPAPRRGDVLADHPERCRRAARSTDHGACSECVRSTAWVGSGSGVVPASGCAASSRARESAALPGTSVANAMTPGYERPPTLRRRAPRVRPRDGRMGDRAPAQDTQTFDPERGVQVDTKGTHREIATR